MKNHEKSDFNRKSLTSIPFGGPICISRKLGQRSQSALVCNNLDSCCLAQLQWVCTELSTKATESDAAKNMF